MVTVCILMLNASCFPHPDTPGRRALQAARCSNTWGAFSVAQALSRAARTGHSGYLSTSRSRRGSRKAVMTEGSANTLASSCSYRLEHLQASYSSNGKWIAFISQFYPKCFTVALRMLCYGHSLLWQEVCVHQAQNLTAQELLLPHGNWPH